MLKRTIILIIGMAFAGGIYSDTGQTGISNTCDEFFVAAAEREGKNAARKLIGKAEKLYVKAVESYKGGNKAKASEYYSKALQMLSMVDMDLVMSDGLEQDYKTVFSKLGGVLNQKDIETQHEEGCPHCAEAKELEKKYTVPMCSDNDLVKRFITLYSANGSKERIELALKRMGKYETMVSGILKEYDLPEELKYLPIVESLYYNNDLSCAGALGIWQLMPERARALGLKVNYWIDERKDPEKATRAAAQYLKDLYVMFDDWHLALSAYNRGEFGLGRDLKFSKATTIEQMSQRKAVPRETELFVPQFIATTLICDNAGKYKLAYESDSPENVDEVVVNDIVDLSIVAECAGTSVERIRELNPAIVAWCTPHNYPNFVLKLPEGSREKYIEKIASVKDLNPSRGFVKYKVQKGDCLDKIAKKFRTSISTIKEDNNLKNGKYLKINQQLVVRPGRTYFAKAN